MLGYVFVFNFQSQNYSADGTEENKVKKNHWTADMKDRNGDQGKVQYLFILPKTIVIKNGLWYYHSVFNLWYYNNNSSHPWRDIQFFTYIQNDIHIVYSNLFTLHSFGAKFEHWIDQKKLLLIRKRTWKKIEEHKYVAQLVLSEYVVFRTIAAQM